MLWNLMGMFLRIELGIWSGHGVLCLDRCLTQVSYVSLVKSVEIEALLFPRVCRMKPFKSCHGYCLTWQVQLG
jgi:hypothetical protein